MAGWQPTSGKKSKLWGSPEEAMDQARSALQRLKEERSIHQIIDVDDHISHGHDLSNLVKRSLISSAYVVLKMPTIQYRKQGPDEYLAGLKDGWDMSAQQKKLEQLLVNEQLHTNDFCIVLPERMWVSPEVSGGESLEAEFDRAGEINKEISKLEEQVYNLPVGANYATVKRLLRQDNPKEAIKTGILMPDIRNLSVQDLTNLRKDYDGSFSRLRYSLKKYLDGMAESDKESKFAGVIEEIDYECRKAEDEFNLIRKKHGRSLKGMLVTASVIGIAAIGELALPGLFTAASGAIGSLALKDIISDRIKTKDLGSDMEKNDFWIAWKIDQENKKKAKS